MENTSSTDKITLMEYGVYLDKDGNILIEHSYLDPDKWDNEMELLDPFYENTVIIRNFLEYLGRIKTELDKSLDTYF